MLFQFGAELNHEEEAEESKIREQCTKLPRSDLILLEAYNDPIMLRKLLFAGLLILFAQARPPAFEVASIKEREFHPGLLGVEFQPGGRMIANQAPIQLLIMAAYNILPARLQFEPNVAKDVLQAFYDIEAKPEANAIPPGPLSRDNKQKLELMLRALLVDRFKLRMHTEKRELPVYALLADKGGIKLPKAPARDCGATPSPCRWFSVGVRGIDGDSVTLQSLADQLSDFVGQQTFIDQTGIDDRSFNG